uniref:3-hydroxy-3-methylglutaryl coenzyme A reductase n=1 Tax=Clastoptera arizonana TaxID=38151 RepID=A0A1B6EGS7_9HEMI
MLVRMFRAHGEFCASHPWEVIVGTLTLTACMLSMDKSSGQIPPLAQNHCSGGHHGCNYTEEYNAVDMIVMTAIRCIAVLYSYYQFCTLHKLGSKYILGIAGLFTVFSSFVFSSSVINFLRSDITDLKDALFFFLLLIDLSKATILAQFALSASSQEEVKNNIARGMSLLGPTITLDTVVETLVISVGTLSGVKRLEILCCFACMSVLVNYIVFMTFYPACLSLILELSRNEQANCQPWHNKSLFIRALKEEDQKPNPVVQRVKVIMSAGLVVVHAHSRWALHGADEESIVLPHMVDDNIISSNKTDDIAFSGHFMRWLTVSADHIVILILLLALTVKFIFFEDKEELNEQILMSSEAQDLHPDKNLDSTLQHKFLNQFTTSSPILNTEIGEGSWIEVGSEENINQSENIVLNFHSKSVQTDDKNKNKMDVKDRLVQTENTPFSEYNIVYKDKAVQTIDENEQKEKTIHQRPIEECVTIYKEKGAADTLNDIEVRSLVKNGFIPTYQIEKAVKNPERGVGIRRQIVGDMGSFSEALTELPYKNYDYSKVLGQCCENVIGYVPVPVGIAGPLLLDDKLIYVPMATTEGCLVASTNRGSRALLQCGVRSRVVADGMTRGPVVRFNSITRASEAMVWLQDSENFKDVKKSFDSTSRFARLTRIHVRIAGRHLFIRFVATTGDAMGMNMLSKGTEIALKTVQSKFPDMELLSLSGNFCADKKPAAVNWIEGRGKSVVCEAIVPAHIISTVLKTSVHSLVDVNISKNMIGSAVAGSIGGFNAHAANIVTAIFIATGQDPAQNIASSNCMTLMEPWGEEGTDLYVSCTMPSIELGTVGGGTQLPPQAACLDMLGVKGPNAICPGENANTLARIVCGTVLAGELSLMSALAAGHLVKSHLRHNRSSLHMSSLNSSSSPSLVQPLCSRDKLS